MICCLNPHCPQENPSYTEEMKYCASCGQPLVLLLDRYLPIGRMSTGESAVTYFARDREGLSNNDCVIEQISIHNPNGRELVELEVKRLQELSRGNSQIPEILNYCLDSEYLYLVTPFLEGQSLDKSLAHGGSFSEEEVINLLNSLLPVLEVIHSNNIIHRDLRLENIVQRSSGELVLTNFGVTKQSTGNVFELGNGTPGYTPFELKEQSISNPASDLYSLGAACFHLLTGKHPQIPFGDLEYDWPSKWKTYLDRPISDDLSKIIDKLLQKNHRDRYQTAREVSKALNLAHKQSLDRTENYSKQRNITIGSMTGKVRDRMAIDPNDSQPHILKRTATKMNQLQEEIGDSLSLQLSDRKTLLLAAMLSIGALTTLVGLLLSLQRQYQSLDRLNEIENTTQIGDPNLTENDPYSRQDNTASVGVNNQETIEGFTQAIKRNPGDAYIYFQRGNIRANSKDKKGAIVDYTKSIALKPKEPEVYSQRGNAYSAIGNKKAAIEDYTQVIRLAPDRVDAYFHRAIDRSNIGDKKGALEDYNRVIKLEPDRADAYFDRGNTRVALGDNKGAIEDYNKSIQYKPNRAATFKSRGNARAAIGDKQGAAADYLQASKLSKK
jgi:serine/threonine protein kinase